MLWPPGYGAPALTSPVRGKAHKRGYFRVGDNPTVISWMGESACWRTVETLRLGQFGPKKVEDLFPLMKSRICGRCLLNRFTLMVLC